MKNRVLKERTERMQEAADIIHERYIVGLQLVKIGEMFMGMSKHMADLQRKVENQTEALRGNQAKIKEMQEEIEEFEIQTGLMRKRTYYNKFVKEVFQKEKGSDLIYPDFDEIYKRYFELIEQREKIVEQLKKTSYWTEPTYDEYGFSHDDEIEVIDLSDAIEIVQGGAE